MSEAYQKKGTTVIDSADIPFPISPQVDELPRFVPEQLAKCQNKRYRDT